MATATLNPTIEEFRGAIGEIVFKRVRGKIIATKKPVFSKEQEPSAGQLTQRQKFREAAAYAKAAQADPALRTIYEPVARKREVAVYTVALRDYLNAPSIKSFYLWDYRGQPGDLIAIRVKDDFGLAELQVRLTTPDGTPVEGGPAVEKGLHSGFWLYTTTTAAAHGSKLRVEVTGADHAGNRVRAAEEITAGEQRCVDVKASGASEANAPLPVPAPLQPERKEAVEEAVAGPGAWEKEGEEEQPEAAPAGEQDAAELMLLSQEEVAVLWWALLAAVRSLQSGAQAADVSAAGSAKAGPDWGAEVCRSEARPDWVGAVRRWEAPDRADEGHRSEGPDRVDEVREWEAPDWADEGYRAEGAAAYSWGQAAEDPSVEAAEAYPCSWGQAP